MSEETLFKTEQEMSSADIADYLRMIADKVEQNQKINLKSGSQSVDLDTQGSKEFEVKVERETSSSGDETSLELEIEWKHGKNNQLEIE